MNVGKLRQHGDARVDHDQGEPAFFLRVFHAPVNNRMLLRQIGAPGDQAIGVFKIFVTARRAIGAERTLVTAYG